MSRKTFRLPNEVQVTGLPGKLQGAFDAFEKLGESFEGDVDVSDETVPAELYESEDAFLAVVELPGFGKGDIELTVGNGALVVKAERSDDEDDGGRYSVNRTIEVPGRIDGDRVGTQLENGILSVTLPKAGAGDGS